MSGRLVISRHKSYHVWNQDNVEKVMRDERLHREKLEAEAQREKDSLQEKHREILMSGSGVVDPDGSVAKTTDEKVSGAGDREIFNPPEPMEPRHSAVISIYPSCPAPPSSRVKKAEQDMKDRLILQQNGAAPWALGAGSMEMTKKKARYETYLPGEPLPASSGMAIMGKVVTGEEAVGARRRETSRKRKLDPMAAYIPHSRSVDAGYAESKGSDDDHPRARTSVGIGLRDTHRDKKKIMREEEKHRKKAKRENGERDGRLQKTSQLFEKDDSGAQLMNELRRKRLEREKLERKKTAVLLAEVDIYGSSMTSSNNSRKIN